MAAAQALGSEVLELSSEAQAALDAGDPTLMFQESAAWAQGATGQSAEVFIGNGEGYTFYNYELPKLLNNLSNGSLNVINITF